MITRLAQRMKGWPFNLCFVLHTYAFSSGISLLLSLGRPVNLQITGKKPRVTGFDLFLEANKARHSQTGGINPVVKKKISWGWRSFKKDIYEVPDFLHLNVWTNNIWLHGTTSKGWRWNNLACDVRGGVSSPCSHQAMLSLHISSEEYHIWRCQLHPFMDVHDSFCPMKARHFDRMQRQETQSFWSRVIVNRRSSLTPYDQEQRWPQAIFR